jgi:hypothetical protein
MVQRLALILQPVNRLGPWSNTVHPERSRAAAKSKGLAGPSTSLTLRSARTVAGLGTIAATLRPKGMIEPAQDQIPVIVHPERSSAAAKSKGAAPIRHLRPKLERYSSFQRRLESNSYLKLTGELDPSLRWDDVLEGFSSNPSSDSLLRVSAPIPKPHCILGCTHRRVLRLSTTE